MHRRSSDLLPSPTEFLSVKSKGGAKGDGVSDDGPALNAFIQAVRHDVVSERTATDSILELWMWDNL
jgi:hypothetical protein